MYFFLSVFFVIFSLSFIVVLSFFFSLSFIVVLFLFCSGKKQTLREKVQCCGDDARARYLLKCIDALPKRSDEQPSVDDRKTRDLVCRLLNEEFAEWAGVDYWRRLYAEEKLPNVGVYVKFLCQHISFREEKAEQPDERADRIANCLKEQLEAYFIPLAGDLTPPGDEAEDSYMWAGRDPRIRKRHQSDRKRKRRRIQVDKK